MRTLKPFPRPPTRYATVDVADFAFKLVTATLQTGMDPSVELPLAS